MNRMRRVGPAVTLLGVFLLCVCVGIVAGGYIKHQVGGANAASENITVTNNNQISTIDQGTPAITRTSTVTVKDTAATVGYTLSARIANNSIPSSTVSIYSASSTTCTEATPCTITTDPTPTPILETNNGNATGTDGDTTDWTVSITLPGGTAEGNYILDIEYSQEAKVILGMVDPANPGTLFSQANCDAMTPGTIKNLTDQRDNKVYRVKKMIDNRCWMIDNLAFDLTNQNAPAYSPAATIPPPASPGTATAMDTAAQYVANPTYPTAAGSPTYLYNWCAAIGDTSPNCSASIAAPANSTVLYGSVVSGSATSQPDVTGICPVPFRLPKGGPEATSSDPLTTANDFAKLDIAMGGTGARRVFDSVFYPRWTGTSSSSNNWHGVMSGLFYGGIASIPGLYELGTAGAWWSSTAYGGRNIYYLSLLGNTTYVIPGDHNGSDVERAVRCIL